MTTSVSIVLASLSLLQTNFVAKPKVESPIDFKVVVRLFGARKLPRFEADLVVHEGRVFQFVTEHTEEVTIFEPAKSRFLILDLKNRVFTHIPLTTITKAEAVTREATLKEIAELEKDGTRNGRIVAKMTKDLLEASFTSEFDPKTNTLTLKNATVDITAKGVPEPDRDRLNAIRNALIATAWLSLVRDPEGLYPGTQVETLKALIDGKGLLPVETSFYFRLTGAPSLYRWTYELVPKVTDRELEALSRIDQLITRSKLVPFVEYKLLKNSILAPTSK